MPERTNQYNGHIDFKKLFALAESKGLKKKNLREDYNISPTILKRLTDNTNVATDTIAYICSILNCQPGDIMEYVPDKPEE